MHSRVRNLLADRRSASRCIYRLVSVNGKVFLTRRVGDRRQSVRSRQNAGTLPVDEPRLLKAVASWVAQFSKLFLDGSQEKVEIGPAALVGSPLAARTLAPGSLAIRFSGTRQPGTLRPDGSAIGPSTPNGPLPTAYCPWSTSPRFRRSALPSRFLCGIRAGTATRAIRRP